MKLQLLYKTILGTFVSNDFLIKLSAQSISKMQLYAEIKELCFNDLLWIATQLDSFKSKPFEFEYESMSWDDYSILLDKLIPNLDEGFKSDMISNLELLDSEIVKLSAVSTLDDSKIINYLDEKYRNDLNLSFFELFHIEKEIKDQLKVIKNDPGCSKIINEIFLDHYPPFAKMKLKELNNGSILLNDVFSFGFIN